MHIKSYRTAYSHLKNNFTFYFISTFISIVNEPVPPLSSVLLPPSYHFKVNYPWINSNNKKGNLFWPQTCIDAQQITHKIIRSCLWQVFLHYGYYLLTAIKELCKTNKKNYTIFSTKNVQNPLKQKAKKRRTWSQTI